MKTLSTWLIEEFSSGTVANLETDGRLWGLMRDGEKLYISFQHPKSCWVMGLEIPLEVLEAVLRVKMKNVVVPDYNEMDNS